MSEQKKYEEVGEVRDLPGNIFEWLGRNYDKITPEQREDFHGFGKETRTRQWERLSCFKCRDIEKTAVLGCMLCLERLSWDVVSKTGMLCS